MLHDDVNPDVILIYIGTNDRGFEIDVGIEYPHANQKFYGSYRAMLRQLKTNYPSAKIICATLLMGELKDTVNLNYDRFMREDDRYNVAIRLAVKEESCLLADIARSGKHYETLDYCHPTKSGHKLMAKLWIEALKSIL